MTNVFSPENHPTFHPSYSHISSTPLGPTSRLITLAGQIGRDSTTNTTPSSFLEQVDIALKNVKTCLDAVSLVLYFPLWDCNGGILGQV
jgi:enamine deaminase RidA (YjgF/YER057c/UK114 family)